MTKAKAIDPGDKRPDSAELASGTRRQRGRPARDISAPSARETILICALQEFGVNGFDGVNLATIAKRAGVAKPLLHYHFESKEQLWRDAVAFALDSVRQDLETVGFEVKGLPAESALRVVLRRFALFCARNPAVTRISMYEVVRRTERARWLMEHYVRPIAALSHDLLAPALREGKLRIKHPAFLFPMINGAMQAMMVEAPYLNPDLGVDASDPASLMDYADNVVDAILWGLLERTP